MKSKYYEFVFSYFMDGCKDNKLEPQKCRHLSLKRALHNYADALLLAEDFDAVIAIWEQSLPSLVNHYQDDAYFITKLENGYFETAVKLGLKEQAVRFLKQQGLLELVDLWINKIHLAEEIEDIKEINTDYHGLSSTTVSSLASLRKEVELTESLHGKNSFKYRIALEQLRTRLNNEKSPEAITLSLIHI